MKHQEPLPEDRLLDDLVTTPEREEFFASVEKDLLSAMAAPAAHAASSARNGWLIGSLLVAAAAAGSVAIWYSASTEDVVVTPQAPYQISAPATTAPPPALVPAPNVGSPAPLPTAAVPNDAAPQKGTTPEPTTMKATARSSSPVAVRAMREADSLRALLQKETSVQQQLTLRYDIGVRLRMGGQLAEAEQHLLALSADAQAIGAHQLSARSQQQAALSARDLGDTQRARQLLINAINELTDGSDKLRQRWQKDLEELGN